MVARKETGRKAPFTPDQLALLRAALDLHRDYLGLALLNLAVDTMLRRSDLLRLTVGDLRRPDGTWRETFERKMQKTGRTVACRLLPHTVAALDAYVKAYRLSDADRLFKISTSTFLKTVKGWVYSLGLDPAVYGTHSLRRTKATALARNCSAAELDEIRELLGHKWLSSTQSYLGTTRESALALASRMVV
jgi:integrase